jgi:hypothetical protein
MSDIGAFLAIIRAGSLPRERVESGFPRDNESRTPRRVHATEERRRSPADNQHGH